MNLNKSAVPVDTLVFSAPPQQRCKVCKEISSTEMISAQLGQAHFQGSVVRTAVTGHNCHRSRQFWFPSPCAQGMCPGDCFQNVHGGKMWTASSVLCFTILSRKLYPSVFCHNKWLILPSDLAFIQSYIPVLLCECMRDVSV